MGRFNFNKYEAKSSNSSNDLDIKRLSRELINKPSSSLKSKPKPKSNSYKVGVALYFMSGQIYKTPEFTVDDIYDALQQNKRWLDQENGGAINLGYVVRYTSYKFYERENHGRA